MSLKRPHAIEIWGPTDRMLREIELRAPWMQEDEALDLDEINLLPMWQRKPKARTGSVYKYSTCGGWKNFVSARPRRPRQAPHLMPRRRQAIRKATGESKAEGR